MGYGQEEAAANSYRPLRQSPASVGGYDATATESPISRELDVLAKNIAELEMVAGGLIQRLQPISIPRPSPPAGSGGTSAPVASASTVGDAIAASSQRIRAISERLASVRDELAI